ncbi:hypothetical protein [Desertivirga arenae]|nr:hypothetical protein [Pedobacter sp. SYSU D00823]
MIKNHRSTFLAIKRNLENLVELFFGDFFFAGGIGAKIKSASDKLPEAL